MGYQTDVVMLGIQNMCRLICSFLMDGKQFFSKVLLQAKSRRPSWFPCSLNTSGRSRWRLSPDFSQTHLHAPIYFTFNLCSSNIYLQLLSFYQENWFTEPEPSWQLLANVHFWNRIPFTANIKKSGKRLFYSLYFQLKFSLLSRKPGDPPRTRHRCLQISAAAALIGTRQGEIRASAAA